MKELLNQLNIATSGSVVIIGGYAKHLNGYLPNYTKNWMDIVIQSSSIEAVQSLGTPAYTEKTHTWGSMTDEQFVVITGPRHNKKVLDVFVTNTLPDYTVISGSKVITPSSDLDWHLQASSSLKTEHLHNKVKSLKDLYNIS